MAEDNNAMTAEQTQTKSEDGVTWEVPDKAIGQRELADAVDRLKDDLAKADSIAEDCPALCDLFHEVRTSNRRGRDGKHVAVLDYDSETDTWESRFVTFLESGTHLRETGADLKVSFKPYPFIGVRPFASHIQHTLTEKARAARQSADQIERSAKDKAYREENWSEEDNQ